MPYLTVRSPVSLAPDPPGEHPLSEGQRALWVLDRLDPAAAACHLASAAQVRNGMNPSALSRALGLLVERHPALRTTFEARDGEPVRRVHAWLKPDVLAGAAEPAGVSLLLGAEAFRAFDLERGPLWRVRVWSLPDGTAVLLMAFHHLIVDFASVSLLLRDLVELYRQERGGTPARIAPPGPGMTEWIARLEARLDGPGGESLRGFWLRRLGGELPVVDLPADRPRPAAPTWRGIGVTTRVEGAAEALRTLGRSCGATLFATALAGLQAVLHRWTGEGEVLVGVPAARRGPGFAAEVGYFVNPVVLRLEQAGEPRFADLAAAAGVAVREALAHGAWPFARLARDLRLDGEAGRALLRVMAVLQPARTPQEQALAPFALGESGARAAFGELDLESLVLPEERVQNDLLLMAAETEDGGLALSLRLDADLFDPATAGRLLGHLATFLREAAADPGQRAGEIGLLSPAECDQLAAWSAGPPSPPPGPCLHELIAEQAARTPEATALVHADGQVTYGELRKRTAALADHLRGLGVGPEVRVGVCARRTPDLVVGLLSVLESGGAYVPLDPGYPSERLAFLLEDSGAALVLTDRTSADRLPAPGLPRIRIDESFMARPGPAPPRRASPENLAYLIYTSGSTGRPKAVAIEHRSAVALALWARSVFADRELDGVLAATSIGFDLSVFELLVPLCHGGRVVLAGNILDLPELPAAAGVRLVNTVPSALAELLAAGALPASVEAVSLAGEPLRRELVRALFEAGVRRVINLYGPSEDTTYSTWSEPARDEAGEPPIGRPVAGTQARVLGVLNGGLQPVPPGVAGELFLGGAGLARGYLGRPGLTAERFVPSPFAEDGPGARLYRTGDRSRFRPDGELLFLGRLDDQVKIRGFRVEPGEVEAALAEHPEIGQAVVLALGEGGERRLVAFVTPSRPVDLRAFLAPRLPDHLVPSAFVFLDALPRTPNGKVDRRALAALGTGASGTAAFEPPRTPLEAALAAVWREVLDVERVGVHDDFFGLGGHSLLALRVQARIRERLGVDPPLSVLFRVRTVAGLALALGQAAPDREVPVPVPRPRDASPLPLSFAQEGFWLLHRLDPASPAYHVAGEVRLSGPLDPAALAGVLGELVRRHEALRTRFLETPGGPVQVVEPETAAALPVVCLEALPVELRAAAAADLAREEARRPFDLAAAPPLRTVLLRLDRTGHRLLLVLHHVAADEASLSLLTGELGIAYGAIARERPSPLAPPRLQMGDVALWERARMQGETLAALLEAWEERLAGLPPLDLPGDHPRPPAPGWRGGAVRVPLPEATMAPLTALARREGATLFMVLLAGFQAFLSRLTGSSDFAVGSPFSLRGRRELEGVVGPLLNTLVLRADLAGDPTFRELLGRVRTATLAAHEQADLPFELLVERLRPERSAGANPLVQVAFVLHRPPAPFRLGDLAIDPRPIPTGAARLALTLFALERPRGIELEMEHAASLWGPATAARRLDQLAGLLAAVAADPGLRLSDLPLLAKAERCAILHPSRPATLPGGAAVPRTPLEQLLAGIWEDVLGVERPGLHDDFFALGGQSLLATRVVARLREPLGVDLPLRTLFEAPTLAGLAARVEAARRTGEELPPEPPLVPLPRTEPLPLSFGQERLWFLDRLDPGSPVYNMPAAVRLSGLLDPDALERAIEGIAARHEVLRTSFPAPAGTPVQGAAPGLRLRLPRIDLSDLAPEPRQAETLRLAAAEALRPFDLEAGPPLRATLLRLEAEEHVLLLTVHHIAFDGWSQGIFLRELAALYGGAAGLPALALHYADFAAWQRRRLEGAALEPSLAWWRERLAGALPVLALPLDRPRPPVQTFRGDSFRLALRDETAQGVRDLGRRLGATPFMIFLAAWAALLSRVTAETDLMVGTAVAGRDRPELEPLIGLFAENLVLRLDLAGNPGFAELLARARETTLSAWEHQEVPFERLVRELRPERDLSHTPFYQAVLTLDASDRPPLELPGVRLEALPVESGTAKFDLALYLEDRRGAVSGLLEVNRDLFDRSTATRLLAAFERLVEAVVLDPELRVAELPALSAAERHQLLIELAGEPVLPGPLVPRWIEERAAAAPEAPAVSGRGGPLSYGGLGRRAEELAQRLRALGVGPEVRVAVRLDRSPELIVAMLGIWKAGGVYVPLDPTHPEERLAWIVEDSRAPVVVDAAGPHPLTPSPIAHPAPGRGGTTALPPSSAAYVIYTSGSTGLPKGVVVSHEALAAYAAGVAGLYGIGPGDRVLQSASLGFDLSLDEIVPCLTGGAELVLREDALLASTGAFLEGCRAQGISVLSLPTAFWHEIAAGLDEISDLPPSLRLVILGGERLLPDRLEAWRRRFPAGPRLLNTYGPTEATILVTAAGVTGPGSGEAPIGRPLPGAGIWRLGRHGEPVPAGVPGEVCIGGSFLARGYLGQADRTAERFVPHPFSEEPGARLYRTGDLARLRPDGALEFAGRVDEQVKVRGYRVEPGEVEAVLVRHPGLAAAAVVAREDGSGRKRLVGYVVPRDPAPAVAEIRAFLAASLPEPLVPSDFVVLESLPLTPHGKVDRAALPEPAGRAPVEHVSPRDEMEREVAAVWREALGVERVGIHDNFFDLGGHSLVLARVHVLLKERLGREVSIVDLFRHPTVAALARRLSDTAPAPAPEAARVQERAERSRTAARQGRFLQARQRMAQPPRPSPPAPLPQAGEGRTAPSTALLRFAEQNPEILERASFAALAGVGGPYPLQPWPALVERSRVAEMERVSTGLVRLVKGLPRRVFGDDPERIRDFYDLASAELARSMLEEPNGLADIIGRGDFLDTTDGFRCLELNLVSDLGGWQAPLWAEALLRVPVFGRFLRETGLRVACRDTVSLLFAHVVGAARDLGTADGEINTALVLPAGAGAPGPELEAWLGTRYAETLRALAPGADGALLLRPYSGLRESGGRLWVDGRPVHAAVEIHHEGTAAQAFRCFKAGTLKLFNAPVRTLLTDKRNLALLSELAERGEVLEPAERELVARHVPWTRRLAATETTRHGRAVRLPDLAREARPELVLKRAREGQGAAVWIGAATPEAEWNARIAQGLAEGDWILQDRVEPIPSLHLRGERGAGPHDAVWGLFVLGERYGGGFLSLAPREEAGGVVNLTKGASAGVIFEVLDDER